jgi:MoaD family protein
MWGCSWSRIPLFEKDEQGMCTIRIPTMLRSYTEGQKEVALQGKTVGEAIENLVTQYPPLQAQLFKPDGQLRLFVNLFLNEDNIKNLEGLQTPLNQGDILRLVPNITGGRC